MLEKEIPYDKISSIECVDKNLMKISFYFKKNLSFVYIENIDNINELKNKIEKSIKRFKDFIKIANDNPEENGVIMSKEELKGFFK